MASLILLVLILFFWLLFKIANSLLIYIVKGISINNNDYIVINQTNNKTFRPTKFEEYIGQNDIKTLMKEYISAVKVRMVNEQIPFPHFLISGASGTGKTTLVNIIANELGVKFVETIASDIKSVEILIEKIQEADGGILFIDEIHGLSRDFAEAIYQLMEDFKYQGYNVKPFTIAGATTELGEIISTREPLYERFKIPLELEKYNAQDLAQIAKQYKDKVFPNENITEEIYLQIGNNSRGTPRKAIKILEAYIYLNKDIQKTFKFFKLIKDGYTSTDLTILQYLHSIDKPIGVKGLLSYLGTSLANYEHFIEPYLLQTNMIQRTARGRIITEKGKQLLEKLSKQGENNAL